ncbi:hypothetical protein HNQ56_004403 [Anaerotaenia torta]
MAAKIRLKLNTPMEVRRTLVRVSNMVANGEMDVKSANSIILACNAVLGAIRIDEQEKKIAELEQLLREMR